MRQREIILSASFMACFLVACSNGDATVGVRPNAPGSLRANVGGFSCAVTYDAITQTDETELQPYGVEAVTDSQGSTGSQSQYISIVSGNCS